MTLEESIKHHEGLRLRPYRCSSQKTSIGYGRNIEDVGITKTEALFLLNTDIENCRRDAEMSFWFYENLNQDRKDVLCEMLFNLGLPRFLQFTKLITALEDQEWDTAAIEMLDSKWSSQVGQRAVTLANKMKKLDL